MTNKITLGRGGRLPIHILNPTPFISKENPQQKIERYNSTAIENRKIAAEIGRKIDRLKQFIQTTNTANRHSEELIGTFKELAGLGVFNQVCSDLVFAINKTRSIGDMLTGFNLLKQNFQVILGLKDADGRNPLSKILDKFAKEYEAYLAIDAINDLASTLVLLQSSNESTTNDLSQLRSIATLKFKNLPSKAKNALCEHLNKLSRETSDSTTRGIDIALQDIGKLLSYCNTSPIEDCLSKLEKEINIPYESTDYTLRDKQILLSDTQATVQDIIKIYQLEELKCLLNDETKSNDVFIAKYDTLNGDLKKMLGEIIFIASYEPDGRNGESLLRENLCALVRSKNKDGVDVLGQLISHYSEKVRIQRLHAEIASFTTQCSGYSNNHGSIIQKFNPLSHDAKEVLKGKVWWYHGGMNDKRFHWGWTSYGNDKIYENGCNLTYSYPGTNKQSLLQACSNELKTKWQSADINLLNDLKRSKILPENPIDVSTRSLENETGLLENLPKDLRVAFVTAELKGIAGVGGLAPALEGMIQSFGADYSKVIMPLYRGDKNTIKKELIEQMKPTDYDVYVEGNKTTIRKAKINGIRCYFIDLPHLFWIPNSALNLYKIHKDDYNHNQYRWAVFQRAAADLCYLFSKKKHPVELVHVHDGQAALVPKFLITQHLEEWEQGKTPVSVFTAHNNLEQCSYSQHNESDLFTLEKVGLPRRGMNSFMEALQDSDVQFTVSETFGKEMQMSALGRGIHNSVKKAAFEGHFYGVVNGNTTGVSPIKDEQLVKLNLNYGPNLDVKTFSDKIKAIQGELCKYLQSLDKDDPCYAILDPELPIVVYLGRYDHAQKGVDKFETILEETLANGAQFVCIGSGADEKSKEVLARMKETARNRRNKGVLILEDASDYRHQNKFKGLLRGGCSVAIFPSWFEPCGLVQGEFNCYGKKAIATNTGGFADTLKFGNGYLFDRHNNWGSNEQNQAIKDTLKIAIGDAFAMQRALYHGNDQEKEFYVLQMQEIIRRGLASSWESTPDNTLSPTRRIELVYAKGFQRRNLRAGIPIDLSTVKL